MKNYKHLFVLLILTVTTSCSTDESTINSENLDININLNRQSVGNSANDFLSDSKFTSLVIELVYVDGFEPNATSISNFVSFIENRTYKPNGITVEKRGIISPGLENYTIQDIADIEIQQRQNYNSENKLTLWVFFADGEAATNTDSSSVLGTAYWNTSFVIYEETIQNLSNSPFQPNRSVLETTIITHEFGHILGLTNLGSPMEVDHEDLEHPKHCNDENCLMFWATESSNGLDAMANMTSAPALDNACINDLIANGGK
ncbi:membrane metalloprotease [Winogradskyella psychrotolerans]|uniref:membrane metalloprotease n=1 Tax=Winogradskyella psychrotolerans TaxID=1344585 RepID=UPI001C068346|nr:membrane metalloprotease [Winogradskyella psychrotolerans]MBU2930215.1 membrane metalloprotease [Winogradskyella psychrotolerans]